MAPLIKIILATLSISAVTIAAPITSSGLVVRQLAGEGAACNSVLSSTDNGVGYGIENAEDNTAGTVSSVTGSIPKTPAVRRQLDKIANGAANIANAAGVKPVGDVIKDNGDSVDGTLTSGAADAGAQVGKTEESTLEGIGSSVPKL